MTVKRRVLINLTLAPLLDRLRGNSSEMNRFLLRHEASMHDLDGVIGICEANVRAVKRRLGVHRGRFCNDLLVLMVAYRRQKSVSMAGRVYDALQRVIQEIANRVEEIRIMGP
jgi:hypothetical protein